MQLKQARNGNGLNGERHKSAIAILMKGVLDKGRSLKDDKSGNGLHQQDNSYCPMVGRWDS